MSLTLPGTGGLVIPAASTLAARPALGDSSQALVDSGFVQRAIGNMSGLAAITATGTLSASDVGKAVNVGCASAGQTISLPAAAGLPVGSTFVLFNMGNAYTLARTGTDVLSADGSNKTAFAIPVGAFVVATVASVGMWYVGGPGLLSQSGDFALLKAANGYQKLPNGLIIQWGSVSGVPAGGGSNVNFPITFPNAVLNTSATIQNSSGVSGSMSAGTGLQSLSGMTVFNNGNTGATAVMWMAIGY